MRQDNFPLASAAETSLKGRRVQAVPLSQGLIGAQLLEQNDEWAVERARYVTSIAPSIGRASS